MINHHIMHKGQKLFVHPRKNGVALFITHYQRDKPWAEQFSAELDETLGIKHYDQNGLGHRVWTIVPLVKYIALRHPNEV